MHYSFIKNNININVLALLFLVLLAVAGVVYKVQDLGGWILLVSSYLLVAYYRPFSREKWLLPVLLSILTLHHIIALVYAYQPQASAIWIDAVTFHNDATRIAAAGSHSFMIGYRFYEQYLAIWYRLFGFYILDGGSLLLGSELSIITFLLSMMLFVNYLEKRNLNDYSFLLVLLLGGMPATVIYTSITLRESLELATLMLFAWSTIALLKKPDTVLVTSTFAMGIILGAMHKGLIIYFFFLLAIIVLYLLYYSLFVHCNSVLGLVAVGVLLLYIGITVTAYKMRLGDDLGLVRGLLTGTLWKAILGGRGLVENASPRSGFGVILDPTTLSSLVKSYGKIYLSYLLGPFPWQVHSLKDAVGVLDALIRWLLLFGLVHRLISRRFRIGLDDGVLLFLFVSMTALWALGTTNYGQALRHQVLTNWMLLLLGSPSLLLFVHRYRAHRAMQSSRQQ